MPQSLVRNYVHLVFSTKYRQAFIQPTIQKELHAYLAGTCNKLECYVKAVGGVEDHVHILCTLSQKIALMDLVNKVKSNSSKWIKTQGDSYNNFYWQNGYGGFLVNPTGIDGVINYIQNQEAHHQKRSFQEEYRLILKKYQIEYDERYVWD